MARRKGISSNTIKSRGGLMTLGVQQPREQTPARDTGVVDNTNENMKPNCVVVESPRESHNLNNNDSRYLHKKFKKMATVVQVDNDLSRNSSGNSVKIGVDIVSSRCEDVPMSSDSESVQECTSSIIVSVPSSTTSHVVSNSSSKISHVSWQYNVQTNYKEYSHIVNSVNVGDGKGETLNLEDNSKILAITDSQDTCETSKDLSNISGNGKHICPYCKLSCAKPSVLQKHIRAHTNERPYPCIPCGFAFKTKSNLYKHCRSRSHALRLQGSEDTPNAEEEWSLGSETDVLNGNSLKTESTWSLEQLYPQGDSMETSTETDSVSSPNHVSSQSESKSKTIYKPKFHKANLYVEDEDSQRSTASPNSEFLKQHISKIISDNEAIVDARDSLLHRKYMKDSSNHKVSNDSTSQQPLNLTKTTELSDANYRKRCYSESFAQPDSLSNKASQHPLNPEGSIIKDLLLKARAQARGLLPVTSETYDASETLYTCSSCQIPFRSADNLEIHTLYYCKSNSAAINSALNGSLTNSRELLRAMRPDNTGYIRSNSVHVTLPETYNPNTLAKLASSTLRTPLRANKPENLVLHKSDSSEFSTPLPSPGPLLGNTRLVDSHRHADSSVTSENNKLHPSPVRRKDESSASELCSLSTINQENTQAAEMFNPQSKVRNVETPTTLRSLEELSLSPIKQNSTSLQMFGGEVKILDNSGGSTTMRIEPLTSQQSSTMISQSRASPKAQGPESIVVRSGLHSGGTIVHNPPTPKEPLPSPHPQTPRLLVSIAPNISTPNLSVTGIPAPNMTKFQFPPIGSITAFNPLTLPPLTSPSSPGGPTTILHGGKLIPYVPGMPGPNSLSSFLPIHPKLSLNMMKSIEALNNVPESKRDSASSGDSLKTNITITPVEADYGSISKKSNHNTSNNEKRGLHLKVNNTSHSINAPITKFTIPTVKITQDLSSPSTSKTIKNDFTKSLLPQQKIDELVKRNSEILQKNDISREAKLSSPSTFKFQLNKVGDKQEIKHKDNSTKFSKHSTKLLSNVDTNQFNFENLISKSEILIKPVESTKLEGATNSSKTLFKADEATKTSERSETSYFKKAVNSSTFNNSKSESQKTKFLRPTSLPLKPGTFTPKRHHGITPNANTLPLISPETPRPAKAYGQLYLNGHAYTYLGLKCSTKVYYCTLNRPQPTYVPNQHSLSMYSNWQVCSEATPHPLGLAPGKAMVHYDSRHRPQNYSVAKIKQDHLMTHSSQWSVTISKQQDLPASNDGMDTAQQPNSKTSSNGENCNTVKSVKNLSGGFESNEEYTYVRGRGRGRYVCSECGIRCKKPSMLKKHIRTHTDVRPFTCKHCAFSFKTKGNLTKHMKSKAHYKKCMELGISPLEEGCPGDDGGPGGDTDEESDSEDDANDGETESSDTDSWKSKLEHEAAHCLLSLWGGRPAPGLLSSARPTTYPYSPNTTEPTTPGTLPQDTFFKETSQSVIKKRSVSYSPTFKHDNAVRSSSQNEQLCYPMDLSKPMDLSRSEESRNIQPTWVPAEDILTPVGEPDLLASLVQSSAKLPQLTNEWHDDEPMLQAYLTEKALQDSKMKQSQYKNAQLRQVECSINGINDVSRKTEVNELTVIKSNVNNIKNKESVIQINTKVDNTNTTLQYNSESGNERSASPLNIEKNVSSNNWEASTCTENAKFVASEYLKAVCGKTSDSNDVPTSRPDKNVNESSTTQEETSGSEKETEIQKMSSDHVGVARKVVVEAGGVGFKLTPSNDYSTLSQFAKGHVTEDGRSMCVVCNKTFSKPSQLRLHINIHYMERPFRCSACAVSFRTRGHLQKHERSGSHHNKVSMTSTFGAATTTNPRPFKCSDCKIAFRIHGHLAKHLRSKMHVMRLECLGKLPFGTFAEIERAGVSLTDIDTTDCDNSLASLQLLAQKLHEKDPTKLEKWDPVTMAPPLLPPGADSSDEDEPASPQSMEGISEGPATACSDPTTVEE